MTTLREEAAKSLRRAVTVLETDGWTQGTAKDSEGRRCAVGALMDDGSCRTRSSDECHLIFEVIVTTLSEVIDNFSISGWNDVPGRTVEEVKAALLEAANRLDREE